MSIQPQWFFGDDPALSSQTKDGLKKLMEYVWTLRDQAANQNAAIAAANNTVTSLNQTVKIIATAISGNNGGGGNNNATAAPPVIFGTHAGRLSTPASSKSGYLYVETDRFQATYYSNGNAWILVCAVATGSFENRYTGLNNADTGFYWIETSRNNIAGTPPYPIYQWRIANWNYLGGEFYRNQSQLATLANTFNSANSNSGNDLGALVNVIDFAGQLQWGNNGNNFVYGPQDCGMHGAGPIPFESDPSGNGWHLYDGTNNVAYLKPDGTTGNVNLANLASSANVAFLEFGSVNSGVNPAVPPVFAGNAASGSVSGTFSGNSNNFTTGTFGAGLNAALTGPNPVHVSGNVTATFTGNNVTGNISNNGTPPSVVRRAWFRQ